MMNCEYILQNEIHEKFLKGLLSEEQKAEFESHLKSCESCKKAFENEKILFKGIQQAGRQAMKLEIERQVDKLKEEQSSTDWTLLFKVAAVLFFLVIMPGTLYYLNTDLFTGKNEVIPHEELEMMSGIESEEAESVDEGMILEETEPSAPVMEMASSREHKEESAAVARGKGIGSEIKARKRMSAKELDTETLDDVLGNVEGGAGVGGLEAAEDITIVSEQSALDIKRDIAPSKPEPALGEKKSMEKLSRRAPTVSSKRTMPMADKSTADEQISGLGLQKVLDAKQIDVTVYRLLPSEPILLQEKYKDDSLAGKVESKNKQLLNFSSGYKHIQANVVPAPADRDGRIDKISVNSFKVILTSRSSEIINMNWYPNFDLSFYQPDRISITQPDESNLQINLNEKYIFKVDISKDTTEAILQK